MSRLARIFETGLRLSFESDEEGRLKVLSDKEIPPEPNTFFTHILKCDKIGWATEYNQAHPLFKQRHTDLSQAKSGHNMTVSLLAQGKLKLTRLSLD